MMARTAPARRVRVRSRIAAALAVLAALSLPLLAPAALAAGGAPVAAETAFPFAQVLKSVVTIETYSSQGSGVVVTAQGHVLTNAHVLDGEKSCTIYFGDKVFTGHAVLVDEDLDLAVLSSDLAGAVPMAFTPTEDLHAGMDAFAVGSPEGLPQTVTRGMVSVVGQPYYGALYLQTDASITYGNSGGPLCGADGRLLGLNTFTLGDGEELGFAIPNDAILGFLHRAKLLMDVSVTPLKGIPGLPGYYDGTYPGDYEETPTEAPGFLGDPHATLALLVVSAVEALLILALGIGLVAVAFRATRRRS